MEVRAVDYGYIIEAIQLGSLDMRDEFYEQIGSPLEELEEILFNLNEFGKFYKIGKLMCEPFQTKLIKFIRAHKADIAWTHHDIPGIDGGGSNPHKAD